MEYILFLKERLDFIKFYFETGDASFREEIRKIENLQAPYDNGTYEESGEPPYMEEWQRNTEARDVLGRSCLSMLSGSLQLYFQSLETQRKVKWKSGERKKAFSEGMIRGYQKMFADLFGVDWSKCPADMGIIEQITLARNRDQHPDSIFTIRVTHSDKDREKYPQPFFMSEYERKMQEASGGEGMMFMDPEISVSPEALYQAINQVEELALWLRGILSSEAGANS